MESSQELKSLIEEATYDYTMGDETLAVEKLSAALENNPDSFEAWHALAEIHYSRKDHAQALDAAEKAHALRPDDLFINTTLSRIWVQKGDKAKAEHFGAQAKIQSWKEQLKDTEGANDGIAVN